MSLFSKKRHFCRKKTAGGNRENLKQGLGAAARPAAAAARPAARPAAAAARPEGAAARPGPPRRPKNDPGGLRCPPLGALGVPKDPKKPRGPHGALGAPWGPCGALGAPCGPPLRCGNAEGSLRLSRCGAVRMWEAQFTHVVQGGSSNERVLSVVESARLSTTSTRGIGSAHSGPFAHLRKDR